MIDDMVIVDAVVHPWNMSRKNQNPAAQDQIDAVYASHELSYDEAHANTDQKVGKNNRNDSYEERQRLLKTFV